MQIAVAETNRLQLPHEIGQLDDQLHPGNGTPVQEMVRVSGKFEPVLTLVIGHAETNNDTLIDKIVVVDVGLDFLYFLYSLDLSS